MEANIFLEYHWPYMLTFLPPKDELDRSAREMGALLRKRGVASGEALLRLALAYGFCGLSLRQTAAWAQVAGVADVSDVALLKRLRASAEWLGHLLCLKLAENAPPPPRSTLRIRLFDATSISCPGSMGTDWRIHLGFDLSRLSIDHVELTNEKGGESLKRFTLRPGEVAVGDRGYAHRKGLHGVRQDGADFIIRLNWQNIPLMTPGGGAFDLLTFLRKLPDAEPGECAVIVAPSERDNLPELPARLVAIRKSEAAAEVSRAKVLRERSRKGRRTADPRTLETAGYVFVLTSLPTETLSALDTLETYRFRWQVELAFKRLKSLLYLDELPARDPPLARAFIFAKLLAALLLEDFTDRFLAFSPWGYRLARETAFSLAYSARPS